MDAVGTAVTARESEVLALVGRHLTNAQIAAELFISVRTVEAHVAALLRKTQLPDRRSLARQVASEQPARSVLPVPVTPFIGRAAERAALAAGARRAPPRHGDRSRRDRQEPTGDQRRRGSRRGAARRLLVRRPRAADGSGGGRRCGGGGRGLVAAVGVDAGRRVGRVAGSPRRSCSCWTTASTCSTAFATASSRS